MKLRTTLAILTLVLASCTSIATAPPKANTLTAAEYFATIPTPINTPHAMPPALGIVTQTKSFNLYDERVHAFENRLQFTIRILDVSFYSKDNLNLYIMRAEGTMMNVSDQPVVITKSLRSGFTVDPEVYWNFVYNGKRLTYGQCCADGWFYIDQEDYIILQPNDFQSYIWEFSLPLTLPDPDRQEVALSGQPISITAIYGNKKVGYTLQNKDFNLVTTLDENGENIFYIVDMNAWVGEVQSNSIKYVFP